MPPVKSPAPVPAPVAKQSAAPAPARESARAPAGRTLTRDSALPPPPGSDAALRRASLLGHRIDRISFAPATGAPAPVQLRDASEVIQRQFVRLTEARIVYVQNQAQAAGENLDAEYLQGLWEKQEDQQDGENGNADPTLYIRVRQVAKRYIPGQPVEDAMVRVFARVDDVAEPAVPEDIPLWMLNEAGPFTPRQIGARVLAQTASQVLADKIKNDLVLAAMTGGEVEEEGGEYGAIEFRFAHATGDIYVLREAVEFMKYLAEKHPHLTVIPADAGELARWKSAYQEAKLPYYEEREGATYLYVEESLVARFAEAIMAQMMGGGEDLSAKLAAASPSAGAALPAAPLAVPKTRQKNYERRATRGSRDAGQKAAMSGFSARDYVARFNAVQANAHSWEWLHIQGSRLGGPNLPQNLVAGTSEANTEMIPYERAIYRLSQVATREKPVEVTWSATVQKDADGAETHIGNEITMAVNFPSGAPDATDAINPEAIGRQFGPATVNAVEGATFTKFDRDILEMRGK